MEIIRQRFCVPSVPIKLYAPEFLSRGQEKSANENKRKRERERENEKGRDINSQDTQEEAESDREQNSTEFARLRVVAGSGSRVCRRM